MFDVLFDNPKIISIAKRIYCYVIRDGSITTNKAVGHSRKWVHDLLDSMSLVKGKLETIKEKDNKLYEKCSLSLEQKMPSLMAKILSSDYSLGDYKQVLSEMKFAKLLPIKRLGGSIRMRLSRLFIIILTKIPLSYIPANYIYSNVFMKYIYPSLNRNK